MAFTAPMSECESCKAALHNRGTLLLDKAIARSIPDCASIRRGAWRISVESTGTQEEFDQGLIVMEGSIEFLEPFEWVTITLKPSDNEGDRNHGQ